MFVNSGVNGYASGLGGKVMMMIGPNSDPTIIDNLLLQGSNRSTFNCIVGLAPTASDQILFLPVTGSPDLSGLRLGLLKSRPWRSA